MNWQPIETAPIDGTLLLTYDGARHDLRQWDTQPHHKNPKPYWKSVRGLGLNWDKSTQPTHWMPLPPPPTVSQSLTVPPVVKDSLTPALPMDDDLDEPLRHACSRENPECEACQ